jgi:hypothetical protein
LGGISRFSFQVRSNKAAICKNCTGSFCRHALFQIASFFALRAFHFNRGRENRY